MNIKIKNIMKKLLLSFALLINFNLDAGVASSKDSKVEEIDIKPEVTVHNGTAMPMIVDRVGEHICLIGPHSRKLLEHPKEELTVFVDESKIIIKPEDFDNTYRHTLIIVFSQVNGEPTLSVLDL